MIKPHAIRSTTAFFATFFLVAIGLSAQTLARPGWVGSGLTAMPWFRHAILYEIDTRGFRDSDGDGIGDLKGITQRLDYIHSLGIDAILLEPLFPAGGDSQGTSIDPALGSLDDFDELTREASRLKIRVLLEMPKPDPALARFWLTRGVAGFHIPGDIAGDSAAVQAIRRLLPTYVGQRVLITDANPASAPNPLKTLPNELILDRVMLKAASADALVAELRVALEQSQALPHTGTLIFAVNERVDSTIGPGMARTLATVALLNRSAALIYAGQELGFAPSSKTVLMPWGQPAAVAALEEVPEPEKPAAPVAAVPDKYQPYVPYVRPAAPKKPTPPDPATAAGQEASPSSLLNFYRDLGRLHHGSTALRDGEQSTFNHDDRNVLVWVRVPASPTQFNPPVLIACNLSDKPVAITLKADVARLQLHGSFLKTLLRSDDLTGGTSLDPITLPPYGVFIGDLRY